MRLLSPQLLAFLAVVKHKTVHAAADALFITQTGVTQRIRALETRLSTSLFVRSRRGMLLTAEGEALFRYCQEVQELEGAALSRITGSGLEQTVLINITGPTTMMHTRIIPQCATVMRQFPKLLLQFDINDNEKRINSLLLGESQLAVIEPEFLSEEMEHKILKPENYILVVPTKWKHRKLKDIINNERIIDFDQQDQMTFNYLKHFDLFDLANKDRHFVNRTDTLALMITEALGYGVLPTDFAQAYIDKKRLVAINSKKAFQQQFVLAWFPRHQQSGYFSRLIDECG